MQENWKRTTKKKPVDPNYRSILRSDLQEIWRFIPIGEYPHNSNLSGGLATIGSCKKPFLVTIMKLFRTGKKIPWKLLVF
jgi:hypothetical protein